MNLHGRFSGKKNKGTENIKQAQIHLHLLGKSNFQGNLAIS
jgi:hypothetical protein